MRNLLAALFLAVAALSLLGCLDKTEKVILNPDGSGKVELNAKVTLPPQFKQNNPAPDMQAIARKMVVETMRSSEGVDAWEDLSYAVMDDGRVQIKGIIYFPKLEQLKISVVGMKPAQNTTWKPAGAGMELVIDHPLANHPNVPASQPSDEQVDAELKKIKAQWTQMKPMMTMMMSDLHLETTYVLPGEVKEQSLFQSTAGGVKLVFEGGKILEAMDKIMSSQEDSLRQAIKMGKNPMGDGTQNQMMENMFGSKGPIRALVVGDMKPQFDYQAQMTKAKNAQPEMEKKLGLDTVAAQPMTPPGLNIPVRKPRPAPAP